MEYEKFFEAYNKFERKWANFLSHEISYHNTSALGMTALRICYYVVQNPNCALKEIALSLNISLGSASQMVHAMTIGGLLSTIQNKDDRRRIAIAPSETLIQFFSELTV